MLNKVIEMGRLTRDPEIRATTNGTPVCTFTIAVDRNTREKQTDFLPCIAWRGTAEFVAKYFHKGSMIALVGSVQSRSYSDKNGNNRTVIEICADEVSFTGEKKAPEIVDLPDDEELPF